MSELERETHETQGKLEKARDDTYRFLERTVDQAGLLTNQSTSALCAILGACAGSVISAVGISHFSLPPMVAAPITCAGLVIGALAYRYFAKNSFENRIRKNSDVLREINRRIVESPKNSSTNSLEQLNHAQDILNEGLISIAANDIGNQTKLPSSSREIEFDSNKKSEVID